MPNGFKCCGLCSFLLENLDLTKVPLSEQEDEIQTNSKDSAENPIMAKKLLSPIDKSKKDLETDHMSNCNLLDLIVILNIGYLITGGRKWTK